MISDCPYRLESSCECHDAVNQIYERLFGSLRSKSQTSSRIYMGRNRARAVSLAVPASSGQRHENREGIEMLFYETERLTIAYTPAEDAKKEFFNTIEPKRRSAY